MKYRRIVLLLLGLFDLILIKRSYGDSVSVNLQTFQPALNPGGGIGVEATRTPGALVPFSAMWVDWAIKPLRRFDTVNQRVVGDVVSNFATWHFTVGLGITSWLSVGVDIPVAIYQDFDRTTPASLSSDVGVYPGITDIRLVGKFRIIDNQHGKWGLSIVPQFTFPTGDDQSFRGSHAYTIEPRIAIDYRFWKEARIALNVGVLLRTSDQVVGNVQISHQIRYGLGVFIPLPVGFNLLGELVGSTSLINGPQIYSPLEILVGTRWEHPTGFSVSLGGGVGLVQIIGVPAARVFLSIAYVKVPASQKALELIPKLATQPSVVESVPLDVPKPPFKAPVEKAEPVNVEPIKAEPAKVEPPDPKALLNKVVIITKDHLQIRQLIRFVTNKATINRASYGLLDSVVTALNENPTIHLRIEGHSDSRGSKKQNLKLSQERADNIRDYLISKGISPLRLISIGRGIQRPEADNRTRTGQDKNRRVEFVITQQ